MKDLHPNLFVWFAFVALAITFMFTMRLCFGEMSQVRARLINREQAIVELQNQLDICYAAKNTAAE